MYRRNSVNINELINRFEPTDDDFGMAAENVKYVKITRPKGKMYPLQDDENTYDDENSLIKYTDNFHNRNNKKRSSASMTNALEITKQTIAMLLSRISGFLEMVSKFPFPRMSVMSFGLTSLLAIFICPRGFTERAIYPGFKLIFSVIYPAYRSFKAVRNKDLKEYLKWIVYWIVYAFFTCIELLSDAVLSWFPFYFEIKVISFIWLLGPSSRGSMKVYKTLIHPMLISREQEIDDVIQIAQDRGYMHVFRLGSKSVNYANRIIMQETKAPADNIIVSHQLMKNMSLSNMSDADNEVDESLRLRKFSLEQIPLYGSHINRNYNFEQMADQHRRPSVDYRYDEISSGYSSPDSPSFYHNPLQTRSQAYIEDDREIYYRNLSRNSAHSSQLEIGKHLRHFEDANREVPRRKASINELSKDEIASARFEVKHREEIETDARMKKEEDLLCSSEMKEEFLRWMDMKQRTEIPISDMTSTADKSVKVNAVVEEMDVVSVVNTEHKEEAPLNDTITAIDEKTLDFDEFKDVISDNEQDNEDYLKVALLIEEEWDDTLKQKEIIDTNQSKAKEKSQEESLIPTVIESKVVTGVELIEEVGDNTIDAALTLSNEPLEVVLSLSSSSYSLASEKSLDEVGNVKKRPASHSKGRAPPPPSPNTPEVIPGQFYDHVTKKFFKETEL